ncbi:hypothetical protein L0F63_000052 [Massospora cicadina]|nr:hypothetical protein L0F63_000052 [Massospora cicadina]
MPISITKSKSDSATTTLAAAIVKVLSTKKKGKVTTESSTPSDERYTATEVVSDKRTFMLIDFKSQEDFKSYSETTSGGVDIVLLVVDIDAGVDEKTKKQLELARPFIKPEGNLVVFLNKLDLAEESEQVDLVELSVRGLFPTVGLDSEKSNMFFRGSASLLLDSNDRKAQKPIIKLMEFLNKIPVA